MSSETTGVYPARKKDGSTYYRASVTYRRKHISLGSFDTATAAHRAYNQARLILNDKSCGILDHHEPSPLSFEKWVSLINFRDNGLYIANPIYIMRQMFFYYLSPSDILKFDAEELFFYSSHKIMRRGGHYFVADYGMQINILNRYGIRSYAVEGRDYTFANGDKLDLRSTNIRIINRYMGVQKKEKNGRVSYRSRIHINGNFIVGEYDTEMMAAIAYNKAVDILKSRGSQKNYIKNYIDDLGKEDYQKLYESIEISPRLYEAAL